MSLAADRSQRSADILQCAEDMDETARKWSTEERCKLVFVVYSVDLTQKRVLFCLYFNIFDAGNIKPAAVMPMSSSSLFSLKRH